MTPIPVHHTQLCVQSCLTLCNPRGCSPPGSSVYGISQARILVWVAISSSGRSSWHNRCSINAFKINYYWDQLHSKGGIHEYEAKDEPYWTFQSLKAGFGMTWPLSYLVSLLFGIWVAMTLLSFHFPCSSGPFPPLRAHDTVCQAVLYTRPLHQRLCQRCQ